MCKRKSVYRLASLALFVLAMIAMTGCNAERHVKKGDFFFSIGEYFDAAAEYKKAYTLTKRTERDKRGERAWKMAECYRRIGYSAKAAGAYQNAIRYKYPDSLAILYLAQQQHKMGDYKNAQKNYQTYAELDPLSQIARNGALGCRLAPQWKAKPTLYTIQKQPVLSSRRQDFCPALGGDEWDQLYITSSRPQAKGNELSGITGTKFTDIFVSKKDDKGRYIRRERFYGTAKRSFYVGEDVKQEDIKAKYTDGVLVLDVPKVQPKVEEEEAPKYIDILG